MEVSVNVSVGLPIESDTMTSVGIDCVSEGRCGMVALAVSVVVVSTGDDATVAELAQG
jgi:hypothetical protein